MSVDARALSRLRTFLDIATRSTTPRGEAENAAMHACRLIKEHGLLDAPAQAVPVVGSIDLRASLLLVKETPFAYRFAFAAPNVRRVGAPWTSGWLQKEYVQEIRWASDLSVREVFRLDPARNRIATDFRVTLEAAPWVRAVRGAAR